ncbi:MAG: hypothetical protein V1659_00265 [Candidatus Woesearchaeota archaeon]
MPKEGLSKEERTNIEDAEAERDMVTGRKGKSKMADLNKKQLTKYEMDEIFCDAEDEFM